MTSPLAQMQRTFLATMRGGDDRWLLAQLAPGRYASPDLGLAIYRNAYASRLREALENDHPVLGAYLGDELWSLLCTGYIAAHPSSVRSLRHFGDSLPGYLRTVEPFAANPQSAELAALERLLLDCFDAADAECAQWNTLLATPEADWPGLRLGFHPSVRRHPVAWNSVEIWRAIKEQKSPPSAMPASNGHWLIWRDCEFITRFRSLDDEESDVLLHCLEGGDFSGLCERLLQWHAAEAVPSVALRMLNQWCLEGLISDWQPAMAPGCDNFPVPHPKE